MIKLLLTKNTDSTYDKIFKIIDSYSTFFKVSTENEYETDEGYVIVLNGIEGEAYERIVKIKGVKDITE